MIQAVKIIPLVIMIQPVKMVQPVMWIQSVKIIYGPTSYVDPIS